MTTSARIVHFAIGKRPAGEEGDAQGAEEIRTDAVRIRTRAVLRGDGRLAFGGVKGRAAAIERHVAAQADGLHGGNPRQAILQFARRRWDAAGAMRRVSRCEGS